MRRATSLVNVNYFSGLRNGDFLYFRNRVVPTVCRRTRVSIFSPIAPTPVTIALSGRTTLVCLPCFIRVIIRSIVGANSGTAITAVVVLNVRAMPACQDRRLR